MPRPQREHPHLGVGMSGKLAEGHLGQEIGMSEFPQHSGRRQHGHELVAAAGTGETRELSRGQVRSVEVSHRASQNPEKKAAKETEPGDLISSEWGKS